MFEVWNMCDIYVDNEPAWQKVDEYETMQEARKFVNTMVGMGDRRSDYKIMKEYV